MNQNRRKFLSQVLAAGIFTATCPHISLGRLIPALKDNGNSITGIYHVKISDFPVLSQMYGSVRMTIEGIPPEFHYPKMIVSRIDKQLWGENFSAVSESCPHEGYPIELLSTDFVPDPLFECKKGHGSLYQPTGKYFWGVSKKNLVQYSFTWDSGDNLYIEVPALTTSEVESKIPEISYMSECYPNPANGHTRIMYGTENLTDIDISICDISGRLIKNAVHAEVPAGNYELNLDISELPSGNYIFNMTTGSGIRIIRKLAVTR